MRVSRVAADTQFCGGKGDKPEATLTETLEHRERACALSSGKV